jgi:hypothetical protein
MKQNVAPANLAAFDFDRAASADNSHAFAVKTTPLHGFLRPTERTAAKAMLNEEHTRLPQHPLDQNLYTLGSIAGHNIVIACLPLLHPKLCGDPPQIN